MCSNFNTEKRWKGFRLAASTPWTAVKVGVVNGVEAVGMGRRQLSRLVGVRKCQPHQRRRRPLGMWVWVSIVSRVDNDNGGEAGWAASTAGREASTTMEAVGPLSHVLAAPRVTGSFLA